MAQPFCSGPNQPGGAAIRQGVHRLEQRQSQTPMTIANPAQEPGEQCEQKAIRIRVIDPMIPDHGILLPLWYVSGEIYVGVLMIMNLLPAPVDVAENIRRVKRKNQAGENTKHNRKPDNSSRRLIGGSVYELIPFPEQEQQ